MQDIANRLRRMDAFVFAHLFFRVDHRLRGTKHKTMQILLLAQMKGMRNLSKPIEGISVNSASEIT